MFVSSFLSKQRGIDILKKENGARHKTDFTCNHRGREKDRERINRGIWSIIINTHLCICVSASECVCVCVYGKNVFISRWLTEIWLVGTQSQREKSGQKASFLLELD